MLDTAAACTRETAADSLPSSQHHGDGDARTHQLDKFPPDMFPRFCVGTRYRLVDPCRLSVTVLVLLFAYDLMANNK